MDRKMSYGVQRALSIRRNHELNHTSADGHFDHAKHDPHCRDCRAHCTTCDREWRAMPMEAN